MAATGTSSFGDGLVLVAFPLLAVTLSSSPLLVAGVAMAGKLPWLLMAVPAGAVADRMDRRRLVAIVEVLRAFVLLGLGLEILTGRTSLAVLYLVAFIVGALETAFAAAILASVPRVVHPADLPRANGYLDAAQTAGKQFAGPAVGGAVFAWLHALPFLADAVSFVGSAALLANAFPHTNEKPHPSSTTLMSDVGVGLRWFRDHRLLRLLAVVVSTFAFCQSAVMSVLVLYGLRVLHLSNADYGLFLGVGALGDVLGSLLAHRAYARLGPSRAISIAGVTAAAGYLVLAVTSNPEIAAAAYALEAVAVALGNVASLSLRHRLIPADLFGRVNNAFRMCVFGVIPLGALAGGLLTTGFGLHTTLLIAGLVQLCVIACLALPLAKELYQSGINEQ